MSIFTKINNVLEKAIGVRITKTSNTNKNIDYNQFEVESPLYIEFVGVPGVGKSTLHNSIDWDRNKCLTLNHFVDEFKFKKIDFYIDGAEEYQFLAKSNREILSDQRWTDIDYYRSIAFCLEVLKEDFVIKNCNNKFIVVSDEGIFHNFAQSSRRLKEIRPQLFERFISNRKVVFCYTTPDVLAYRIMKRKEETGNIIIRHRGLSQQELLEKVKIELEECRVFVEWLKLRGVECLFVNAEEDVDANIKKIESFVAKSTGR